MCKYCDIQKNKTKHPDQAESLLELSESENSFNTLAQLGTNCANSLEDNKIQQYFELLEKDVNLKDSKQVKNWMTRKYLSSFMAMRLQDKNTIDNLELIKNYNPDFQYNEKQYETADFGEWIYSASPEDDIKSDCSTKKNLSFDPFLQVQNTDKDLMRTYTNMYNCGRIIIKKPDGSLERSYCKNRLCLVCNAIRQMVLKQTYEPVLKAWESDMYMITLTIKNIRGKKLKKALKTMLKTFVQIKEKLRKRHQRNPDEYQKFEGLRKMEITSLRPDDYHPHFHIIVRGAENSEILVKEWLNRCKRHKNGLVTDAKAQQIDKADIKSTKELFKYFTKIISNGQGKKDKDGNREKQTNRTINIDRLDHIFKSIRGMRTFQPYGFKISDYVEQEEEEKEQQIVEYQELKALPKYILRQLENEKQDPENKIHSIKTNIKGAESLSELLEVFKEAKPDNEDVFSPEEIKEIDDFNKEVDDRERTDNWENFIEKANQDLPSEISLDDWIELKDNDLCLDNQIENKDIQPEILGNLVLDPKNEYFVWDTMRGNWFSQKTGKALINEIIQPYLKDITKSMKIPLKHHLKWLKLYKSGYFKRYNKRE